MGSEGNLTFVAKVNRCSEAVNAPPLVVLWDIDGTLMLSDGAGQWSMEQAFMELFGVPHALRGIPQAGHTDEAIFAAACQAAGLSLTEAQKDLFRQTYGRILREVLASGRRSPRALPGVTELLERLTQDPRFLNGLLTGNWRETGVVKLASVGLDGWFAFGAFGDDAQTREDLLPVALRRAAALTGLALPAHRAVVVGDTPRDVAVALAHGAFSIGVATGPYSRDELARAGATLAVQDLTDPAVRTALASWHASPGPEAALARAEGG